MKPKFFKVAEKMALHGEHHQHKVGAAVVRKNRVIGVGFNKVKTSPKSNHKFKMIHAELAAVLNAGAEELQGSTVYVFRKTRNNTLGLSKPCESCEALLKSVGVKKVCYSIDGGYKEENYA